LLVYDLPVNDVVALLKESDIEVQPDDTVKSAASKSGNNPIKIFELIKGFAQKRER